jgi:TolB-like protein/Tfp pilus assembly protein PilF
VLPLDNLSGDAAQDFFADGITETLIAELAKLEGLRVISRTSAMRYRGARRPLPEIAAELGVDAVVEGSVMRSGDRVRVTAQLIHAASDTHLWADSFDRELSDVLTLQSEAARAIADQIRVKLSPKSKARLAAARRVDPAAYEAYLRGRHHLNRRTEASLLKAADFFRQAIDADPTYALAHVGLGDVHNLLGYFSHRPPADSFARSQAAARRALELDPGLGEAHTSLAYALHYGFWDWRAAEDEYRKGIELSPNYPQGHLWYMNLLVAEARFDEALEQCARVRELDPIGAPAAAANSWVRYFMRDYDGAIAEYERVQDLDPSFGAGHLWFSWPLTQTRRFDEAIHELESARDIFGDAMIVGLTLARVQALAGDHAAARSELDAALAPSAKRHVPSYLVAFVHDALGESASAWEWLERAAEEHAHWLVFLDVDPRFDGFRSDPRFEALRRRVGIQRL